MFLGVVLKAEKNLLYALATRRDLYEKELQQIKALSSRDKWDKTTESLCGALLISALFAEDGATKQQLLQELKIKSNTTLNTKLNKLRTYDLIEETKAKKVSYYKLKHEKLSKALSTED